MSSIAGIVFDDRHNYDQYDVALFMTYEDDLYDLVDARKSNPQLTIGLIDPRGRQIAPALQATDFFVVDGIEMRDHFARHGVPMFTYHHFADIGAVEKVHSPKDRIVIGYHGNKVHLMSMYPNVTRALELLGQNYAIEFWAMYDIAGLGKWELGVPGNIPIRHVQWSEESYLRELGKADIGIVPAQIPIRSPRRMRRKISVSAPLFLDREDDYLLRFKMLSNSGRFITFGKLGIPVVADMYPSALQFIRDGENGLVAHSCAGWYRALEKLIVDNELRGRVASRMRETIEETFAYAVQNERFIAFLRRLQQREQVQRMPIIEEPSVDFFRHGVFWSAHLKECYSSARHGLSMFLRGTLDTRKRKA